MFLDVAESKVQVKLLVNCRPFIHQGCTNKSLREEILILRTTLYIMDKDKSSLIRALKAS